MAMEKTEASPDVGKPSDDMDDGKEIEQLAARKQSEPELIPLHEKLVKIGEIVGDAYRRSDRDAATFQKRYKWAALISVTAGVVAVLIAIVQLWISSPHGWALPIVELLLVTLSIASVVWSFHCRCHDGWLAARSKAERLRSLKYRALLDPAMWSGPDRLRRLAADVKEIDAKGADELAWLLDEPIETPLPSGRLAADSKLDNAIAEYYIRRRLVAQSEFCSERAEALHRKDRRTKLWGPILFFLVLVFVFAHATFDAVDLYRQRTQGSEPDPVSQAASRTLIVFAAVLPLLGAGVHTYRSGRESGRNMRRFRATYLGLSRLQAQLDGPVSPEERFRILLRSEYLLAAEHQQWLQLMIECEWFG